MSRSSGEDRAGVPVAYDVTTAIGVRTGIGRAVLETWRAIRRLPDHPTLVPFALGVAAVASHSSLPRRTRVIPVPTRGLLAAWSRAEHPRLDAVVRPARVIHATSFLAPPSRLPVVVTVHDCAFALYPDTVTPSVRAFGPILGRAVRRGVAIHCATHAVATEVDELYGPGLTDSGRITVAPFGIPDLGPERALPPGLSERIGSSPFVLALARLEPRKNLPRLVRAFGLVAERHPDLLLVLAGPDGPDRPAVDAAVSSLDPDAGARVVLAGGVSDSARRALLEDATVLAYPSLYEGFGFPMLEAMEVGVPVVAAGAGALPEVAGGAAFLADPVDVDAIAGALEQVVSDDRLRLDLVERGRDRARSFSWNRTAEGLCAVYRELAATSPRR